MNNKIADKKPSLWQRVFGMVEEVPEEEVQEAFGENVSQEEMKQGFIATEQIMTSLGLDRSVSDEDVDTIQSMQANRVVLEAFDKFRAQKFNSKEERLEALLIEVGEWTKRQEEIEAKKSPEQVLAEKEAKKASFEKLAADIDSVQRVEEAAQSLIDSVIETRPYPPPNEFPTDQYGIDDKRSPEVIEAANEFNKASVQSLINLTQSALDHNDFRQVKEVSMAMNKFVVEQVFGTSLLGELRNTDLHLVSPLQKPLTDPMLPFNENDLLQLKSVFDAIDGIAPKKFKPKPKSKKKLQAKSKKPSKPKLKKAAKAATKKKPARK